MTSVVLVVWSVLICALGLPMTAGLARAQATELPENRVPDCVAVNLKTHNFNVETLEAAHGMGFRIVRRGIYWSGVEREKGVYDFSQWDAQMDRARELGLRVILVLFSHNDLYDQGEGGFQTQAAREGFAAFAAAAAEHYKGHDVLWEIWNEPNTMTFWGRHGKGNSEAFAEQYTALVKAVAPAIHEADPEAYVMAGSVSNYWGPSYEWTEFCFQKGILETGIQAWSVHPYGVKTPEEFAAGHTITRDLLKQYGAPEMPILNTERGFAVKELDNNEGWSGGSKERAREFQAWHFVRQFMIDQLHDVRLTVWYEWGPNPHYDAFALVDDAGQPHPSGRAAAAMIKQLDGYQFDRRVRTARELDYVLLFTNEQGERELVAWTAPPAGTAPDAVEARTLAVAVGTANAFTLTDLFGESRTVEPGDGHLALDLSGAPQYVTLPADAELGEWTTPDAEQTYQAARQALNLFENADNWTFSKNTGEGAFTVDTDADGRAIGVMQYDFTQSPAQPHPYVLASAAVQVGESARELRLEVRSPIEQPLTFRLVDSTGQTHQFRARTSGSGQWETVTIPLARRMEHWGGANDGQIYFPITQLVFSVPRPGDDATEGRVEYTGVTAIADTGRN